MVGSVHFGDFSVLRRRIRGAEPAPATLPARRQHIVTPVQKIRLPGNFTWNTYPFDACAPHGNLDGTPCATAPTLSLTEFRTVRPTFIPCDPAQHPQCVEQAAATRERCSGSTSACTELPTVSVALIPRLLAVVCRGRISPKNKNGVFHVKHAARFPPTMPPIRPFSSPTRGTSRSRVDSARVRPPALPAQIRLSPVHNRNRRSAGQPVRSARSAASPRPYRATR